MTTLRQRYRDAFPPLAVVTVVVDALLLRSVDPASPLSIAFWLGAYVVGTFAILSALFLFSASVVGGAHADAEDGRTDSR